MQSLFGISRTCSGVINFMPALEFCRLDDPPLPWKMVSDLVSMVISPIYFFFGTYDIPVKGTDGAWMEGSEEIYDFLVCVLSPLKGEYEMGDPRFGFLYPAFAGRSADPNKIYVFHENPKQPEMELLSLIGTK